MFQNKWINSSKQFQEVTKVSDSLLNAISQYFKFPEWITNPKPKNNAVYIFAERLRKQQGFDFQIFNVRETISYNTWGDIPTTISFEMALEPYKSN